MFSFTGIVSPQPTARRKYSGDGWYTAITFTKLGIEPNVATILAKKANFGLAMNSWKSYASAINNIQKCNIETESNLNLPFSNKDSLTFIGWLLGKGLRSNTASKYLCGVRMWHLANGFDEPLLRSHITKQVLKGAANWDKLHRAASNRVNRLPMTICAMRLLHKFLGRQRWSQEKRARVWCTASICWAGSFRIQEVLSKEGKRFDRLTTLIGSRIKLKTFSINNVATESMSLFLRCPKEDKSGKGVFVEIFHDGTFMCPIQAWHKWRKWAPFPVEDDKPVIREPSGVAYTGASFQKDLKCLTAPFVAKLNRGTFSTHSFR